MSRNVLILPGDGIGPEIMVEAENVLNFVNEKFNLDIETTKALVGGIAIDETGHPWQRIVLLKDLSDLGFVFYTNLESRKAKAMASNPRVSLLFPWNVLERQVIVGGTVERVPMAEAARYFLSRPRESQLAAWASAQSRPLSARQVLEQKMAEMKHKFAHGEVPLPSFWGGYRVIPQQIEFWQGGAHRLHDRFLYTRDGDMKWTIERLAP